MQPRVPSPTPSARMGFGRVDVHVACGCLAMTFCACSSHVGRARAAFAAPVNVAVAAPLDLLRGRRPLELLYGRFSFEEFTRLAENRPAQNMLNYL